MMMAAECGRCFPFLGVIMFSDHLVPVVRVDCLDQASDPLFGCSCQDVVFATTYVRSSKKRIK